MTCQNKACKGFTLISKACKGFTLISKACKGFTLISKACKGFTLIELLVVISIIGVLATLILANFVGIRERARDAQRKSDLNQIQKALEMYKNAASPIAYPAVPMSNVRAVLAPTYMQSVSRDPSYDVVKNPNIDYIYARDPAALLDLLKYKLVVCLENASDKQKDSTKDASCTTPASITRYNP